MGLLSKVMNALIGEPSVSRPATQPVPRPAQQNVPQAYATADDATQVHCTATSNATAYAAIPIITLGAIVISRENTNHSSQYFCHNESFASAISCQFTTGAETYAATNAPCRADRTGAKYYRQNRKA